MQTSHFALTNQNKCLDQEEDVFGAGHQIP